MSTSARHILIQAEPASALDEQKRLKILLYQANHIFLPPGLPQVSDEDNFQDRHLAEMVCLCLEQFRQLPEVNQDQRDRLRRCIGIVDRLVRIRGPGGILSEKSLQDEMSKLRAKETLAIHVRRQNAALLISKEEGGKQYLYEAFELLAPDSTVVTTVSSLQRQFPSASVLVPTTHAGNPRFQKTLASTIAQLDEFMDVAGQEKGRAPEIDRDTADPRLVTSMIMSMLLALGSKSELPAISKRCREEVFLEPGRRSPWRRSALWFMIRVTLQLTLEPARLGTRKMAFHATETLYKDFIIFLMGQVLRASQAAKLPTDLIFVMVNKISRHILKLGAPLNHPGLTEAIEITDKAQSALHAQWKATQLSDQVSINLSALKTLDFQRDTVLELPELRKHIKRSKARRESPASDDPEEVPFLPGHSFMRSQNRDYFPRTEFTQDPDFLVYELLEFEQSVEEYLGTYGYHNASPRALLTEAPPPTTAIGDGVFDTDRQNASLCYHPLQPNEVRLVHLVRGTDSMECQLKCYSFTRAPSYKVLSYQELQDWECQHVDGDSPYYTQLQLDGHPIRIPRCIYDGLLEIWRSSNDDLHIWVDVICVNQGDLGEKSDHVTRLPMIYSSASAVLVWLGGDPHCLPAETKAIKLIVDVASKLNANDVSETGGFSFDAKRMLERALQERLLAFEEVDEYLARLVSKPWFSDMSAVAAASLSAESPVLMLASPHSVRLDALRLFAIGWQSSDQFPSQSQLKTTFDPFAGLKNLGQSCLDSSGPCHDEIPGGQSLEWWARELWHALKRTRHYKCRRPQDKLYGVLGLISSGRGIPNSLAPDYRLEHGVVFRNYAKFLYENGSFLTAMQNRGSRELAAPSWVPDFRRLSFEDPTPATQARSIAFSDDLRTMTTSGVIIGDVAAAFQKNSPPPASPAESNLPWATLADRADLLKSHLDRECGPDWRNMLLWAPERLSRQPRSANPIDLMQQQSHDGTTDQDLFLSYNGLVGICDGAVENDVVVILWGTCRPLLLRRSARGGFKVVGCAALSGKHGNPETFTKRFFSRGRKMVFTLI
ncbi:hypothetical protein B0H66DRAFT_551657 [Apodospora peruviana]|uniref:Heterokaryon incompatibility domain-containing protein n=1 Tax=Apodospora peruviana TaxID=516989 RepID=A0AAE0IKT4_9PEZI|nr:hypothetical protein B0H66DRAFT_551657 [Apodospora peruviana]